MLSRASLRTLQRAAGGGSGACQGSRGGNCGNCGPRYSKCRLSILFELCNPLQRLRVRDFRRVRVNLQSTRGEHYTMAPLPGELRHTRTRSVHQTALDQAALAEWNARKWSVSPAHLQHRLVRPAPRARAHSLRYAQQRLGIALEACVGRLGQPERVRLPSGTSEPEFGTVGVE